MLRRLLDRLLAHYGFQLVRTPTFDPRDQIIADQQGEITRLTEQRRATWDQIRQAEWRCAMMAAHDGQIARSLLAKVILDHAPPSSWWADPKPPFSVRPKA
jgi:hypothetical protein